MKKQYRYYSVLPLLAAACLILWNFHGSAPVKPEAVTDNSSAESAVELPEVSSSEAGAAESSSAESGVVESSSAAESEAIPSGVDVLEHVAVGALVSSVDETPSVSYEVPMIKLFDQTRERYPDLAEALEQINQQQLNDLQQAAALLKEQVSVSAEELNTPYLQKEAAMVRRADSLFTSILYCRNIYLSPEQLHYGFSAVTYNSQTGTALALGDVIRNVDHLFQLLEQQLSEFWPYLTPKIPVAERLRNIPEEDLVWTLDNNGITFYFEEGTLSAEDGEQILTIPFSMEPELFSETALLLPEQYCMTLANELPTYVDLTGDENPEEVVFSLLRNSSGICESCIFMINGIPCTMELMADSCNPFLQWNGRQVLLVLETKQGEDAPLLQTYEIMYDSEQETIQLSLSHSEPSSLLSFQEEHEASPEFHQQLTR